MRTAVLVCVGMLAGSVTAAAQETLSARQLFEAGQYDAALLEIAKQRERGAAGPADVFLAGQILVKMDQNDRAKREFARLTEAADPAWTLIGESTLAILDNNNQRALDAAAKAAADSPAQFSPVLGLLLSPIIAAAAMSFSSLSVVGNALRLRRAPVLTYGEVESSERRVAALAQTATGSSRCLPRGLSSSALGGS